MKIMNNRLEIGNDLKIFYYEAEEEGGILDVRFISNDGSKTSKLSQDLIGKTLPIKLIYDKEEIKLTGLIVTLEGQRLKAGYDFDCLITIWDTDHFMFLERLNNWKK